MVKKTTSKKVTSKKKVAKKKAGARAITVHRRPQGPRASPIGMVQKNVERLIASIDRLSDTDRKDSYVKKVTTAVKRLR